MVSQNHSFSLIDAKTASQDASNNMPSYIEINRNNYEMFQKYDTTSFEEMKNSNRSHTPLVNIKEPERPV